MRHRITTALEVAGLLVTSCGAAMVYVPAGVVLLGLSLILVGAAEGRR